MQSADARNFNWLLNEFARNTAGVTDANREEVASDETGLLASSRGYR